MRNGRPRDDLGRQGVADALVAWMPVLAAHLGEIRIVGTASSALRGIRLPVGDIDVLARNRETVDRLVADSTDSGMTCIHQAALATGDGLDQYLAEFELLGAKVEISTVEGRLDPDAVAECVGEAPWTNYDIIVVADHGVPVVASELRLKSELLRNRIRHASAIAAHLRASEPDSSLLRAVAESLAPDHRAVLRRLVGGL